MIIPQDTTGKKLSDKSIPISRLDSINSLSNNDYLIIERDIQKEFQIDAEKLIDDIIACLDDNYLNSDSNTWNYLINEVKNIVEHIQINQSLKIPYPVIQNTIVNKVSVDINFGTMSKHQYWEYARNNHYHDYSLFEFYPNVISGITVATLNISSDFWCENKYINYPNNEHKYENLNRIGEIKLLACTNREQISIDSDDFDGWVYADGKTYTKNDFPSAYDILGENKTETTFNVPKFENFLKMYNTPDINQDTYKTVKYNNHVKSHTHNGIDENTIQNEMSAIINVGIYYNKKSEQGTALMTGYKNEKQTVTSISSQLDQDYFTISPKKTESYGLDIETFPSHYIIPTMIYIGKKGE